MKVIEGGFDQKQRADELTVPIIKSEDFIVVSTNMDTSSLYFLLDQLKMSLITGGEYEL
jgi:hypothetical protein